MELSTRVNTYAQYGLPGISIHHCHQLELGFPSREASLTVYLQVNISLPQTCMALNCCMRCTSMYGEHASRRRNIENRSEKRKVGDGGVGEIFFAV